jgi:hypothetical protein
MRKEERREFGKFARSKEKKKKKSRGNLSPNEKKKISPITTAFVPANANSSPSLNGTSMHGISSIAGPYTLTPSTLSSTFPPT